MLSKADGRQGNIKINYLIDVIETNLIIIGGENGKGIGLWQKLIMVGPAGAHSIHECN